LRTVQWKDGSKWVVDERTFQKVTEQLLQVREVVWGLEAIVKRWIARAEERPWLDVDEITPSEEDRAIMTAALHRLLEDSEQSETIPTSNENWDYLQKLKQLHELFMTDVTYQKGE